MLGKMLATASPVASQHQFRARVQWARILDKATDIQLLRKETRLDPQTVRVEFNDTVPSDSGGGSGEAWYKRGVIFGVKGHPDIDDFDVEVWDTFVMDGREFTVMFVNRNLIGQIQADFEAVG